MVALLTLPAVVSVLNATSLGAPSMAAPSMAAPSLSGVPNALSLPAASQRASFALPAQLPYLQALFKQQFPANRSAAQLFAPQAQAQRAMAWAPAQTLAAPMAAAAMDTSGYKAMLAKIIAFKRWKMAYLYVFSTRFSAYAASMPARLEPGLKKMKEYLTKASLWLDIMANWEITGFIYCVLLSLWASAPLTSAASFPATVAYYQTLKVVYAFWTWTYFLTIKDLFGLYPDAFAKVDKKFKGFVDVMATFSCGYAFEQWHVSKMMGLAAMTETTSPLAKAQLASFYWDEYFIHTVLTLYGLTVWSWSYPDQAWLKSLPPYIALSLPYTAMLESYYESSIASLQETAARSSVQAASK
jgi:hypothetical protein